VESLNSQFLYAIMIIGIGFVLKQLRILKERDGEGLSRLVFNLTLPALIIVTFHELAMDRSLILLILSGLVYGLFASALGLIVFRHYPRETKGMLVMMVPGLNIGLFAYPLVEGIWGTEGIKHFGMLDVGNAFIVFGVCYFIGSYFSSVNAKLDLSTISKKMASSIPFMTYVIVCSLNLVGLQIPAFAVDVAATIAKANMPMALILLGFYMNFGFDREQTAVIVKFLSLRYGAGIVVGVILFFLLPFDNMFKYTLLMGLVMPTSISALPYSVEFNYDRKFVGTVSNLSILISFLLLWLMGNLFL